MDSGETLYICCVWIDLASEFITHRPGRAVALKKKKQLLKWPQFFQHGRPILNALVVSVRRHAVHALHSHRLQPSDSFKRKRSGLTLSEQSIIVMSMNYDFILGE